MTGKELGHALESGRMDYFEVRVASLREPVRVEYSAIRDLRMAIDPNTEGLGLLLGSSSPHAISIKRCELLALSPTTVADPKLLQGAFRQFIRARLQTPLDDAPTLLGFFRTQNAGSARLKDSDLEIAQNNLPGLDALFLLIQTPHDRPWLSSLYVLDPKMPAELAHEFPFDEYLLRNGYVSALVEAAPPPVTPSGIFRGRQNRAFWIIAASILVVLLAVSAFYKWSRPAARDEASRSATAPASVLNLKVNRSGKDFEISWNLLAAAIQQAFGGKLTIQDGALTRAVSLTGPQLREGRILYTPLFDELTFRLEVSTPNQDPVAESVQVLAWSGKQEADVMVVSPGQPGSNVPARISGSRSASPLLPVLPGIPAEKSRNQSSGTIHDTPTAKTAPATNRINESASARPSSISESATVVPPSPSNSSPTREAAPTPPARAPDLPPQNQPLPTPRPAVAPNRPPAIQTAPQLPVIPLPSVGPTAPETQAETPVVRQNIAPPAAATPSPPSAAPASSVLVPPVPILKVAPALPRTIASAAHGVSKVTTVTVRVMVDSAGSVQSAQVFASSPKGVFGEKVLHQAALDAAKNWKFRPGQSNGKNVPAEFNIDFQF